jgi:hypothetical protein
MVKIILIVEAIQLASAWSNAHPGHTASELWNVMVYFDTLTREAEKRGNLVYTTEISLTDGGGSDPDLVKP